VDENDASDSHRRGIYFYQTHEYQDQFIRMFDAANPNECYARSESIVPQQALAMANSGLTLSEARQLARRLSPEAKTNGDFVILAFETVLNRPPSDEEIANSEEFLREQAELLQNPTRLVSFANGTAADFAPAAEADLRAKEDLVHVLFNHNEFVTVR
jgi:hypothetical protein